MELTAEIVREWLDYDPETGVFRWKKALGPRRPGDVTGCDNGDGYLRIKLLGRDHRAHRLAFLHTHGRWPNGHIDHINGNRRDNRLQNLREASRAENNRNQARRRDNASGYKGVSWNKNRGQWEAYIKANGARRHLGLFATREAAATARALAAEELHGQFSRAR